MREPAAKLLGRATLTALALGALASTPVSATCELRCSCAIPPARSQADRSAAVFWGEVTRVVWANESRVGRAVITVFRSWKGVNTPTVSIDLADSVPRYLDQVSWTAGQNNWHVEVGVVGSTTTISSCDFFARVHDTVLVFARQRPNGQLGASVCGTRRGEFARDAVEELGAGRVWTHAPRSAADDTTLARALGREVRQIVLEQNQRTQPRSAESSGPGLIALLLRAGDISGALESARALKSGTSDFIAIANRQRELGDTAGLVATIQASQDPPMVARTIASEYRLRDSVDRANAVLQRFRLLNEDATGSPVQPIPESAERMAWRLLSRATDYGVDSALSDSLARLAYAIADQMTDSAQGAALRRRLTSYFGSSGGRQQARALLKAARTDEDRIAGLRLLARAELRRDGSLDSSLATVARLEAIAPPRVVVDLLVELAGDATYHRTPIPARLPALRRAFSLSDEVDSSYADGIRLRAVDLIVRGDVATAVTATREIRSSTVRDRAASSIVRRQLLLDDRGHLDTALVTSGLLRDSLYVVIATRQAARGMGSTSLRTAQGIRTPELRATAIAEIAASFDGRNDTPISQPALRRALSLLDPQRDHALIANRIIPVMIGAGEVTSVLTWARGYSGTAGASARMAVMSALVACPYGRRWC